MVLARRIRRCGLGLTGGRVVVVVGAGAGRREVAGATVGSGSCRAVGAWLVDVQPTSTAASTTKPKIRRIAGIRGGTTPQDVPTTSPGAMQAQWLPTQRS
jgi:hypothetical protein